MQSPHEMIAEVIALEASLEHVEFGEGRYLIQMIQGLIEDIMEMFQLTREVVVQAIFHS